MSGGNSMPEPDLLQRQRNVLQIFRDAVAQRVKVEADADVRLKDERKSADTALSEFRQQAKAQRAEAEADVEAHLAGERETAADDREQTRQQADAQLEEVEKTARLARSNLAGVGLSRLLTDAKTEASSENGSAVPDISPSSEPTQELVSRIATVDEIVNEMQLIVDELRRERERRRFQLFFVGGLAAVLAIFAAIYLTTLDTIALVISVFIWTLFVVLFREWAVSDVFSERLDGLSEYRLVQWSRRIATSNQLVERTQEYIDVSQEQYGEQRFRLYVAGGLAGVLGLGILLFLVTLHIGILVVWALLWALFVTLFREWAVLGLVAEELSSVDFSTLLRAVGRKMRGYLRVAAERSGVLSGYLIQQIQSRISRQTQKVVESDDSE